MDELYELMKRKKLTSTRNIFEFCDTCEIKELVETALEAYSYTLKPLGSVSPSPFNFAASISLSGGSYPCQSPQCRISRIFDMAKFSSIYANHVTIYNPFDFIYLYVNEIDDNQTPDHVVRVETANAFVISFVLKPMINRKLIEFSKTLFAICKSCKKKKNECERLIENDLETIAKITVGSRIRDVAKIEYGRDFCHFPGIENLIGEDIFFHYKKLPSFLQRGNKKITIITDLENNNPIYRGIIDDAIDSLMFQKFGSVEGFTQTYLTTSPLEKILLEGVGKNGEDKILNLFIEGIPLIDKAPFEQIIEIRESFPDEFIAFQEHTSRLIDKARMFDSQHEFNAYVKDELSKDTEDLKKIISEKRKGVWIGGIADGLILANIFLSTKINSGFQPFWNIVQLVSGCCGPLIAAGEAEKSIRNNPLYFYLELTKKLGKI